jgi:hypothetical protein
MNRLLSQKEFWEKRKIGRKIQIPMNQIKNGEHCAVVWYALEQIYCMYFCGLALFSEYYGTY